jgi:diphosphomevalonate decarboxylase
VAQLTKGEAIRRLLPPLWEPVVHEATAFAPVNIALVKYWGKRNEELHLPVTDSFSVCLTEGTTTTLRHSDADRVMLNGVMLSSDSSFHRRLFQFLDLVRPSPSFAFFVETKNTVPTAAGLASSASGFAALALALNGFFGWGLTLQQCSVLARLGSGSACRSVFPGFVRWQRGALDDGSDSYAMPSGERWPELSLAVLLLSTNEKPISSGEAMRRTVATSREYALWPQRVAEDMEAVLSALHKRDFPAFGAAAERNALAMHSSMRAAIPPVCYWTKETLEAIQAIHIARQEGLEVYFTMDAGPNIKLLLLQHTMPRILELFPKAIAIPLLAGNSCW